MEREKASVTPIDYSTSGVTTRPPRRILRMTMVALLLWAPYSWLLFLIEFPMRDYPLHWLKMWPILPGLLFPMILRSIHVREETLLYPSAGLVTALLAAAAYRLSGHGRVGFIATAVGLAAYGAFMGSLTYGLYRM